MAEVKNVAPSVKGVPDHDVTKSLSSINGITDQESDLSIANHMEISISEVEKRANKSMNIRDYYNVYLIESRFIDEKEGTKLKSFSVWRRYSEFESLHNYFEYTYPFLIIPPLPEKQAVFTWRKDSTDSYDPDFIDRRKAGLENFMMRVISHSILTGDQIFLKFLQDEIWKADFKNSSYWQQAELKWKTLHVNMKLKRPDTRFEELKLYCNKLQMNLYNLLKLRIRLLAHLDNIHKLHSSYGKVFSEWSAIENDMGDGLQKAGHFMDSYADSIDSFLEEEAILADQLKEYYFYSESIQSMCQKHDFLQYDIEKSEEAITSLCNQKEQVLKGTPSLMSRILWSIDSDEVRELKANQLDEQINVASDDLQQLKDDARAFSERAFKDSERFRKQKNVDLKETFVCYVISQIKMCKKAIQTWSNLKQCLESIP